MNDPTFVFTHSGTVLNGMFVLRRIPSSLILTFYIPSLSIIAMTIVPLYLKDDLHFATTIMLVLTAMLCLYTLFQSSVSDIPKTAYLKYIDYWNILSLVITVTNFFILIVWQMCHDSGGIWRQMKNTLRFFMPLLTCFAVGGYVAKAAKNYQDY